MVDVGQHLGAGITQLHEAGVGFLEEGDAVVHHGPAALQRGDQRGGAVRVGSTMPPFAIDFTHVNIDIYAINVIDAHRLSE